MLEKYYRDYCQRRHKVLGHYLAAIAWQQGADCVVLDGSEIKVFLRLDKIRQGSRLEWLLEDLKPWFPHHASYVKGPAESLSSLFLSRFPLKEYLPSGTKSVQERIAGMESGGPKTVQLKAIPHGKIREEDVVAELALLASGLETRREKETRDEYDNR